MIVENRKSFLEIKVIWKDDEMFELRVTASNINFFGTTDVYDKSECLANFAKTLKGFPKDNETIFYELGEKDCYAYFSMKYYSIGKSGYIGVEINLESDVPTVYRQEEKNKIKLEIIVEPNAIDNFQKELFYIASREEGVATLLATNDILYI